MWQILRKQLLTLSTCSGESQQQNGGIRLAHHTRWSGEQPYGEKVHIRSLSTWQKLSMIRLLVVMLLPNPLAICGRLAKRLRPWVQLLSRIYLMVLSGSMFTHQTRQTSWKETRQAIPQEVQDLRASLAKVEQLLHGRRSK